VTLADLNFSGYGAINFGAFANYLSVPAVSAGTVNTTGRYERRHRRGCQHDGQHLSRQRLPGQRHFQQQRGQLHGDRRLRHCRHQRADHEWLGERDDCDFQLL
jgi:hypothetical protein